MPRDLTLLEPATVPLPPNAMPAAAACSRRSENPSLKRSGGPIAGVKMRQQMAYVGKRQGPGDEGRGTLRSGSFCGSD